MPEDVQQDRPTPDWGLAAVSVPAAESLAIDIVLVHGLNSSRTKPWTSRHDDFWPSWIVQDVPGARVWVYGYNTSVWLTGSNDHLLIHTVKFLESLAKAKVGFRKAPDGQKPIPVVFVGHSLGGVLIKQVCDSVLVGSCLILPGTHNGSWEKRSALLLSVRCHCSRLFLWNPTSRFNLGQSALCLIVLAGAGTCQIPP